MSVPNPVALRSSSRITASFVAVVLALAGCAPLGAGEEDGPQTWGGKADGDVRELTSGVAANGEITSASDEVLYTFSARAGATVHLEVTRSGSSTGLDTMLAIYGPSSAAGRGELVAEDDEAGYGQLSEIDGLTIETDGDYLAIVSVDPNGDTDLSNAKHYRLLLELTESSTPPPSSGELSNGVHWVRNSAEYVASVRQAYTSATTRIMTLDERGELPASWAVVLDVDETILSNSTYRLERERGLGTTWFSWVARREATALPGAREFTQRVHTLGGVVALVTNRHVSQCRATADNLEAVGVTYDVILCQDRDDEKEGRWQQVEMGTASASVPAAEIVMWVGDNIHDFRGMDQADRVDPSAFDDFGTRFTVIPNPMSGSWTSNPQR
ncbi:MAG: HAD family acid phosphatase [Sandaracinaceae bacterium]